MESQLIICNEVIVDPARAELAWDLWKHQQYEINGKPVSRTAYRCEDVPARFLELIAINDLSDIKQTVELKKQLPDIFLSYMKSDWHQQVIELLDTVKANGRLLPESEKIQLRYIEVPLSVFDEYKEWRDETIYEVVRASNSISGFLAYQSVFSTKPGVLFISSYEGDTQDYMKENFLTEHYKTIVAEAGDNYIAGGQEGLFTRSYVRC